MGLDRLERAVFRCRKSGRSPVQTGPARACGGAS
ncbi:hypothetical protein BVRB_5g126060 [Beta vulgaris subsp. vulgaris]|uniref:Uncharacterized protein n=1 Tax=Beta vulgaris subsp. vulgaris TaxID=3555 RepID=A0A0J8B8G3_BETVV|nr:hypothetical protein BVRB_5g126060 [Beta vulgaris subsp. vulgaris]